MQGTTGNQLTGSTWGHERGFGPLLALNELHQELFPCPVNWNIRSLKEFGDHSMFNLTDNYDLVVFDHPFIGEIAKNDSLIGEVVNIATGVEISIEDLAKLLIQKINPNAKLLTDEIRFRPDKSEVFRLLGSSKKLQEHTNWSARVQLEKGLDMTIDWFKENNHQYKTWVYNK